MENQEPIIRRILFFFFIIQRRKATEKTRELRRINPYNPLSYIFLAGLFAVVILLFGIVGAFKPEIGIAENHFKWQ